MKILLLYTNIENIARFKSNRIEFPPIGLLYLASAIGKSHEINILELDKDFNLQQNIRYDIIGLNINTAVSYNLYKKNIEQIKAISSYIIAGGQFATMFYELIMSELNITATVRGEAEEVINQIIDNIQKIEHCRIPGVVTSNNIDAKVLRIGNINSLNYPARHLLNKNKILLNHRVPESNEYSINIITSRGCPYSCAFCGNLYKKVAFRSPENLKVELNHLKKEYKIKHITLLDENVMYDFRHLKNVCEIFKELKLIWTCNARVDSYSPQKVKLMKSSGCLEIKYGIESGDESILKLMNKKISIDSIKAAIKGTKMAGLKTKGFLMFGFPSENMQSVANTLELLNELKPFLDRVNLFNFVPLHNSVCYKYPEKYGIRLKSKYVDYSFYTGFQHWWGTDNEYKDLLEYKEELDSFIKSNFSNREPICNKKYLKHE